MQTKVPYLRRAGLSLLLPFCRIQGALALLFLALNSLAQAPANDNYWEPQPVSNGSYNGTTSLATADGYGCTESDPDVWFAYVPQQAGILSISTCAALPTTLTVFADSFEWGWIVGCSETCGGVGTACGGSQSCLSVLASPGSLYIIRIATVTGAADFELNLSLTPFESCSDRPSPSPDWTRQFGSQRGQSEVAQATAGDGSSFYVAGWTDVTVPGQSFPGADLFLRKYDAQGVQIWTTQFRTLPNRSDFVYDLAADSSGVYLAGTVGAALPGQSSFGGTDGFVRKYDINGNVIWTRQIGTAYNDYVYSVYVDVTGVYVAGSAGGTLPGQNAVGAFLRRYDLDGNEVWTRQFYLSDQFGVYTMPVYEVAVAGASVYISGGFIGGSFVHKWDIDGNFYWQTVMGFYNSLRIGGLAAKEGCGVFVGGTVGGWMDGAPDGIGEADVWIRKLDPDTGFWLWTQRFGSTKSEDITDLSIDEGGPYATGWTTGAFPGQTFTGFTDSFVSKFDCDGNPLWTDQFGTPALEGFNGRAFANAVVSTSAGIAVVGEVYGDLEGQSYLGFADAFIRTYTSSGADLWTRQFGSLTGTIDDRVAAVASDGNLYVTGDTPGILPGASTTGGRDVYVRKYSSDGTELWTRQFGPSYGAFARSIAVDPTGVYVAGQTWGSFVREGQETAGGFDAFLAKLDRAGNRLWTRQFGSSQDDDALGVSVGSSGIWVVGLTKGGILPGQAAFGSVDAFIARFDAQGNRVWIRQFGGAEADEGRGVATDATGAFVVGRAGNDAFIRRYNTDGNLAWLEEFGTPGIPFYTDIAQAVATDVGGVYVTGSTPGDLQGTGIPRYVGSGFVRKYSHNGLLMWTRQFGGNPYVDNAFAFPSGISLFGGDVFVGGTSGPNLDCEPGAGLQDIFVRKFSADGEHLWTFVHGSSAHEFTVGIAVDSSGISAAGFTPGTMPGQVSKGLLDGFVVHLPDVTPNHPPVVGPITAPTDPVRVNTTVSVSADFIDPDAGDSHTAVWNWGDGTSSSGTVNQANTSGTASGSHVYTTPGVYTITVTVTDQQGRSDQSTFYYVVAYDPNGGFVTGGGWVQSPAGAYSADPSLSGRANFGFISKYQNGANLPTGQTEFQFKAGDLNFHSSSYQWLVVAGARAQFKGNGMINRSGNYSFLLTAIDGQLNGGGGADRFRIKIWDIATGTIAYDNQIGATDNAELANSTILDGGSIVIHKSP